MKKNQTDDLFARKLRQAEMTPRPEAWEKLQNRLQTEKKSLAWWQQRGPWLAAAGLSLLLITGWVVWKNQPTKQQEMARVPNLNVESKQKAIETTRPNDNLTAVARPIEPLTRTFSATSQTVTPQTKQAVTAQTKQENLALKTQTAEPTKAPSIIETAPIAQPTTEVAQAQPTSPTTTTQKTVVMQLPELPSLALGAKELSEIPLVETDPVQVPPKGSRFARILRQVQNAKEGQRVDWDEVGLDPNKVLAKVTRRNNRNEDESTTNNK